jgi:hypothetical protein
MDVALLVHVPPGLLDKADVVPRQILKLPAIIAGKGLTVTVAVL